MPNQVRQDLLPLALIIGPYSPDLADPIRQAAGIIENNMRAGRIPDDGFLLLASAPYVEIGVDRAELASKMFMQTAVLNWHSRALEMVVAD